MKLFGSYTSPYVRHCRITLNELGFDYDFIETDYTASAKDSPTMRVPFLQDGGIKLTDSTSILMYLHQRVQRIFIERVEEMELYTMVNTLMDTTINLFLLERDGLTPEKSPYLARQASRIAKGLDALEALMAENQHHALPVPLPVPETRLACFLSWAVFRGRFTLEAHPHLTAFLEHADSWSYFSETAPS